MATTFLRRFLPTAAAAALLTLAMPGAVTSSTNDDILARTRAMYGELRSYADTGVVVEEYGASSKDRHAFITTFRRTPRGFLFDFKKDSGDRYVIWGDPDAFHTWWKTTGVKDDYPNPNNIGAFSTAGPNTYGAALKIPTLLYPKALPGPFTNFTDAVLDGTEVVAGHPCHRLTGITYDTYGATARQTNVRRLMVWIDADTQLIRKLVEQRTPLPGQISRTTTTFEPLANPTLEDSRFGFTPPSAK